MKLDINVHFVVGLIVAIASAIAGGTVHLTNAIPADWIPVVTAWSSIIGTSGGLYLAMLSQSAAPPSVPTKLPAIALLILGTLILGLLQPGAAYAQGNRGIPAARPFTPTPGLTGNPIVDIHNDIEAKKQAATGSVNAGTEDLVAKLGKLALPDFEFALAMSKATNNVVSTPCWSAWVDLLTAQQKPLLGADGQPITEPDPHLATSVEKISELLAALRPDSTLSTGCAALAGAAGKDAATLIQGILGGGALGLFKLPIPIGPIP